MIQDCISKLIQGRNLSEVETAGVVAEIINGEATPAQIGAFLTSLRMKGESVEEIASFASAVRGYGIQINPKVNGRLVDTCGTGGDGMQTFNVSTVSALVAAGAGVAIAKHGNRSVTSKCGSADLLERMGFNLSMDPVRVKDSIERIGIGFMFAPSFHPTMKRVAPIRKEIGIRTIFNLIGPLMNPANANAQLLGVYSSELAPHMAGALKKLGKEEAMVIHGLDGMDEISVVGRTLVAWLKDGEIVTKEYSPEDFGVERVLAGSLEVTDPEDSVTAALDILRGAKGAKAEMVVANAGAAIVLGGKADDIGEGVLSARDSVRSGAAEKKLRELIKFSGGDISRIEEHGKRA